MVFDLLPDVRQRLRRTRWAGGVRSAGQTRQLVAMGSLVMCNAPAASLATAVNSTCSEETPLRIVLLSAFPGLVVKDSYWRWPERGLAGNTIDFFVQVFGLSFHDAMKAITAS